MTRRCGRCGQEKPVDQFMWRRRAKGQRDNYCRACRAAYKREHYLANRERYVNAATKRTRDAALRRTEFLLEYFREHPCVDCGETDPVVLEFDHLRDKEFTISRAFRYRRWEAILGEIEKCEVVCANCHRRRTAKRGSFLRALLADASG